MKTFDKQVTGSASAVLAQKTGLHTNSKQQSTSLLSRAQVAKILGVCPHSVQRMTRKGLLPCIAFNRRLIRYAPAALDDFIQAATVK